MKIAWLADNEGYQGSATLSQVQLRLMAPEQLEIIDVAPLEVGRIEGCDAVCIHSALTYDDSMIPLLEGKPVIRCWYDMGGRGDRGLSRWTLENATNVFSSPLHRDRFVESLPASSELIPQPIALERFRREKRKTRGTCWVGWAMNPGKGLVLIAEWAAVNEPVDFWGEGIFLPPASDVVEQRGSIPPGEVPEVVSLYNRFISLPTMIEPFGRGVIEAWAAGCDLVVNRNVGARHWIENPDALETAGPDYWAAVERATA